MELLAAISLSNLAGYLYVALGLGFVIFVHELGHFAVAKWCGVRVERFSIGFGPVILCAMRGETEYALSIIPFGGYVKMLGQDDIDPNQMASDEVSKDPRSYTSKTVLQRMAIISAGVIMNLVTGTMMFCGAFLLGMESNPSTIGSVAPGSPAWVAGIQPGDTIYNIDGYNIVTFRDVMRRVTLSWEKVDLKGRHYDGTEYHEVIVPYRAKDNRAALGITRANSLELVSQTEPPIPHVFEGTAASRANPQFEPGDIVREVDGQPVKDWFQLSQIFEDKVDKPLTVIVDRGPKGAADRKKVEIKLEPNPMRSLGLMMDIGRVSAIRKGSPADGKFQKGDKITHVEKPDGTLLAIGKDLNPLRLPELLGQLHGQEVTIHVKRERQGADPDTHMLKLTPEDRPGWTEIPFDDDSPMSIPSIGVTCYVLHSVLAVEKDGPADGLVQPKDQVELAELVLPAGVERDSHDDQQIKIDFSKGSRGWPYLFWKIQECPLRLVKLTVSSQGTKRHVELKPEAVKDWFSVQRGLHFNLMVDFHKDDDLGVAIKRSLAETRNFMGEIYLILYNLFTGRLSVTQMQGPIGIVGAAVTVSNQGFAPLLFFLGYLSINLAVLNFLPIPVLDGGHMAFLLYEGIFRKPPSERVLIMLTWVGLALIGTLMITVIGMDLLRLAGLKE